MSNRRSLSGSERGVLLVGLALVLSGAPRAQAVVITSSFGDLPQGVFVDLGTAGVGPLGPFDVAGQTITVTSAAVMGSFNHTSPAFFNADNDPAVDSGDYTGRNASDQVVNLDFSTSLVGAGVSFASIAGADGDTGVMLSAFDGPGGTGTLLGTITSIDNSHKRRAAALWH